MNTFMDNLINNTNFTRTENGAVTHKTTKSAVLDMFALCGAYRNRTDIDCINMFKSALEENESLAMKCLFYLRDCRGGQGERRFFRVCYKWLCTYNSEAAARNLEYISEFGRWDDLIYSTVDTPMFRNVIDIIKKQLVLDLECKTPSLLGKWMPSENASSAKTKKTASQVRKALGLSHKEYRKALTTLRTRINIVEKLMSENRWEEIEFDKLPSKAGLIYKNAFARRDILAKKYETFAKDKTTKVNASTLNPVEIAAKIYGSYSLLRLPVDHVDRLMLQKYWDNLKDYYNGKQENGIAIVDTSGSMTGTPLNAAVSMGAYIAERGHGPFANHFITFSSNPELVEFKGADIVEKFYNARSARWQMDTNIEAIFNLLLNTALSKGTKAEDMPERLYIFSDMEFNGCLQDANHRDLYSADAVETLLESIAKKWADVGLELPKVIFWNLDARQENIPALGGRFSYVSGFSMSAIESVLSGKDGYDLMLEVLNKERYSVIS
jgi:hypothetical protein